jgi:hypothetical protein
MYCKIWLLAVVERPTAWLATGEWPDDDEPSKGEISLLDGS